MAVLRAIGAFFAKIWRWIKETAWVQPLLIVGIIFGLIFSIKPIVDGFNKLAEKKNSAETYYYKFQQSLVNGSDSDADKITNAIWDGIEGDDADVKANYGEKFFLLYVSESCSSCKEAKGGFETLEDHFDDTFKPNDGLPFKMYTIFSDEVTSDTTNDETAFVQYMDRKSYFFEEAASAGYNSDYFLNGKISESDLINVESCDPENFLTPTILLVDFTGDNAGVTEVMFGVSGDNDYAKAELLLDCWNHEGDFNLN